MEYKNKVWLENLLFVVVMVIVFLPIVLCAVDAVSFVLSGTTITALGNISFSAMPSFVQFWVVADCFLLFIIVCVVMSGV